MFLTLKTRFGNTKGGIMLLEIEYKEYIDKSLVATLIREGDTVFSLLAAVNSKVDIGDNLDGTKNVIIINPDMAITVNRVQLRDLRNP
jgi:hypothetical protein